MKEPHYQGNVISSKLIEGCLKGNRKSQQKVYEALYGKMMSVCLRYAKNREEAKDLLQEGFLKVFTKIKNYNGEGSFEGWVRRIVVNTAIDYYRKNKNISFTVNSDYVEDLREQESEEEEEETEKFGGLKAADVIKALQELSPAYRTVFNLYVLEGLTHQKIADQLGISVGTSKSNLAKAKMNLKKLFQKKKVV